VWPKRQSAVLRWQHAGSEFGPLPYTPTETGTAYLCACKRSCGPPLCDGSHKAL
jgi:CDGSH-type Zn-finger protein